MAELRKHEKYDELITRCRVLAPVRTIIVHPCDETSLAGAVEVAASRLIAPILVGPEPRIRALARARPARRRWDSGRQVGGWRQSRFGWRLCGRRRVGRMGVGQFGVQKRMKQAYSAAA